MSDSNLDHSPAVCDPSGHTHNCSDHCPDQCEVSCNSTTGLCTCKTEHQLLSCVVYDEKRVSNRSILWWLIPSAFLLLVITPLWLYMCVRRKQSRLETEDSSICSATNAITSVATKAPRKDSKRAPRKDSKHTIGFLE